MKRPAFQFYPADWRKDAALQSCCLEARGLWHEMMCLMHECEPYGHLSVNGKPMKPAQIARLVGVSPKEYETLFLELVDAGVPSTTENGTVYSRRMVRDEHIRSVRAEAGKKGGNPNLLGQKDKQMVKQEDNQGDNQNDAAKDNRKPTPSSSSSSSLNPSVPSGTDAEASPELDPHEAIFRIGIPWLVTNGAKEQSVRSMLGMAEKQLGAPDAWALMQDCMAKSPMEPVAWIAAAINARLPAGKGKGKQGRHGGFDKIDYHEGVNSDGSF